MNRDDGEKRAKRRLRAPLVFVVLLGALPMTQCLRQDEAECEEAVARLMECCPGFDPKAINCEYLEGDCDVGSVYPSLSTQDSECIMGKSCSELDAQKSCETLAAWNVQLAAVHASDPSVVVAPGSERVCH